MPVCQNCHNKWTWKQTMKTLFRLKCPYCGEKQYESASSRKKSGVISMLPAIMVPINLFMDISFGLVTLAFIVLSVAIICMYPFVVKLSNEIEPLW